MKHVHSDLIKQWADGAEIEYFSNNKWYYSSAPVWDPGRKYRVKPKSMNIIIVNDKAYELIEANNSSFALKSEAIEAIEKDISSIKTYDCIVFNNKRYAYKPIEIKGAIEKI